MSERHKYADAIIAWASGEPIQFRHNEKEGWVTYTNQHEGTPAFDLNDVEWRPKPKKKCGWMNIRIDEQSGLYCGGLIYPSFELAESVCNKVALVKIEFEEGEGL
jgi:hypothetical protein